jgi:uncharacterized sporulation protein YeaH/YhbH (DUF444 family)
MCVLLGTKGACGKSAARELAASLARAVTEQEPVAPVVTDLSSRPAEHAEREAREILGLHELVVWMARLVRPLPGVSYRDADTHRGLDLLLDGLRVPAAVGAGVRAAHCDR